MPCESAVRPDRDLAQVVVVADAGEDDLLALGGLARASAPTAAVLGHPFLGLGRGAVVDRHLVALGFEVPRHRIAHDPQAEKSNFRHCPTPVMLARFYSILALRGGCFPQGNNGPGRR